MKLVFNQKQQETINKIRLKFEAKYDLDYGVDSVSIYIDKKIYNIKLIINIQYVTSEVFMLSTNCGNSETSIMTVDGECLYLETIQDILDNLHRQMSIYRDFISEYVSHYLDEEDNILVDLVEGKLYLYSKVVIGPIFDINNDENYCTFFVNSLTGRYPMKRFTTISYGDLQEDIEFFL